MSEGSGIHPGIKPESQSVTRCAELMDKSQKDIFKKMDNQHGIQLEAIGEVNKTLSFMQGQASAKSKNGNGNGEKREFKQFLMQAIISWGPWIAMIFGLGLIALLKSKEIL